VPRESYRAPGLGDALAWLRDRARLTQRAAAERAGFSRIYLQKLEAGERAPSLDRLDNLLGALGSNREELEGLLASRPWNAAPPRQMVRSRAPARPEEYVRAAEAALSSGSWSSPIAVGETPVEITSLAGELAELRDHYLNLPPAGRSALLAEARRRRYRDGSA
jgi:transcriptional regulator with XRE-family HTH domain